MVIVVCCVIGALAFGPRQFPDDEADFIRGFLAGSLVGLVVGSVWLLWTLRKPRVERGVPRGAKGLLVAVALVTAVLWREAPAAWAGGTLGVLLLLALPNVIFGPVSADG